MVNILDALQRSLQVTADKDSLEKTAAEPCDLTGRESQGLDRKRKLTHKRAKMRSLWVRIQTDLI